MNYSNNKKQNENYMQNFSNLNKLLFWNVDTQYDFMRSDDSFNGALAVKGARAIEVNLEKLTTLAENKNITVINTADWHTIDDVEISDTPDYKTTYPKHCMQYTKGAEYIPATNPKNPYTIDWKDEGFDVSKVVDTRNIILYKNNFNAFLGNVYTEKVLDILNPNAIFVYGVATNVCVNFAVEELLKRNKNVYVVIDAIKELPDEIAATPLENVLANWQDKKNWNGNFAKFVTFKDVEQMMNTDYTKNMLTL
jgi:nicotinamidase/pyrazinamidase